VFATERVREATQLKVTFEHQHSLFTQLGNNTRGRRSTHSRTDDDDDDVVIIVIVTANHFSLLNKNSARRK